ncbi:MAG: NUDIX hydrolase [Chloroflexi bacterium]|nr:NUDIX hydrolase [Chloroflexota bacterium]
MQQRIRVAAVVVHQEALLLARHELPRQQATWWTPPGGRLDGTESILECAEREVREETGLAVVADRVIYLQQFIDPAFGAHNLVLFVLAALAPGTPAPGPLRVPKNEKYIREARFVPRAETPHLPIHPDVFRTAFWDDRARDFPEARFLGVHWPAG